MLPSSLLEERTLSQVAIVPGEGVQVIQHGILHCIRSSGQAVAMKNSFCSDQKAAISHYVTN
jgi:hypothetical protein